MQKYVKFIRFVFLMIVVQSLCSCSTQKDSAHVAQIKNTSVQSVTTVLAKIAENERPYANGQVSKGKTNDMHQIIFSPTGRGVAYIAAVGDKIRVVHNGKPGKEHTGVQFVAMQISPDGQRIVYGYKQAEQRYMVVDGVVNGPFDEIGPPVFSPDSRHVAYEVRKGVHWNIILDGLTSRYVTSYYMKPVFSSDSSKVFYVENTNDDLKKTLVISTTTFKQLATLPVVGLPTAVSKDNNHVAVVTEKDGKQVAVAINVNKPEDMKEGIPYELIRHVSLSSDGSTLAYVAMKGKDSYLVLNGKEEKLPAGDLPWPPVIRPGNQSVGVVIAGDKGAYLYQAFSEQGSKSKVYKEIAELAYSSDGKQQVHGAIRDEKFLAVVNGVDGPLFDRVVKPEFSPDGKFVVYRAKKDKSLIVVVADLHGTIISQHPAYERIFDPVFTEDGKSIAYGVKVGNELIWKVEKL